MMHDQKNTRTDKALGALLGGALGDALGMPTQTFSRTEISRVYGQITDFVAPCDGHPVSHGLHAAAITDDTEQTLLLARHIVTCADEFDERGWAQLLIQWESDVRKRGLLDLLGPSTKRALEALLSGTPASKTGLKGDTNGAAMRIAPVGIATPVEPLSTFVDHVESTCRITHNTSVAIATASAVAAAVSAGVDGAGLDEASEIALAAAREGEHRAGGRGHTDIADRINAALAIGAGSTTETICAEIAGRIGTSVASTESIPAAFAIFRFAGGDAWQAGLISANVGDDTDTIGAISAGMSGAVSGASSLPDDKLSALKSANHLDLDDLVADLLEVRRTRNGGQSVLEGVA